MGSFAGGNMFGGKLAAVGDLSATLKTVGAKLGDTVQVRCEGADFACVRQAEPVRAATQCVCP